MLLNRQDFTHSWTNFHCDSRHGFICETEGKGHIGSGVLHGNIPSVVSS